MCQHVYPLFAIDSVEAKTESVWSYDFVDGGIEVRDTYIFNFWAILISSTCICLILDSSTRTAGWILIIVILLICVLTPPTEHDDTD